MGKTFAGFERAQGAGHLSGKRGRRLGRIPMDIGHCEFWGREERESGEWCAILMCEGVPYET